MSKKTDQLPFVSILVLNWNGKKHIKPFFDSVKNLTYPQDKIEVLFVDNNSSDDSVKTFEKLKPKNARYIQTGDNYGYAGGNNRGFKQAKGELIAVCNNDLTLEPDWLTSLVKAQKEEKADVVVPKIIDTHTKKVTNAGSKLIPESDWVNNELGIDKDPKDKSVNSRYEVTAFCGASPLYTREFLQEVGIYDETFFLYWEDVDLAWRGQKMGKKYIYEPTSVVNHATSSSTGGETSDVFKFYVSRNRVLILAKNGKTFYCLKAFAKVFRDHVVYKLNDLLKAVRLGLGRKPALHNLKLGLRIIGSILYHLPKMKLKKLNIVKEDRI